MKRYLLLLVVGLSACHSTPNNTTLGLTPPKQDSSKAATPVKVDSMLPLAMPIDTLASAPNNGYNLKMKKLPKAHLQIMIPADWYVEDSIPNPMVLLACQMPCEEKDKFCPNFTFVHEPLKGTTFDEYLKIGHDMMKDQVPDYKLISESKAIINNMKAYKMEYRGTAQGIKLGIATTIYYINGDAYIITAMAKDEPKGAFVKYRDVFNQISSSVRPLVK